MADGKWISELTAATPLEDAARWVLSLRLEVVRNHLQLALREPGKDIEHVHQLRVGTRRAGAAVEIFSLCLPEKVYKRVRKQLRRLRRAAGEARDWDVFLASLRAEKQVAGMPYQPGADLLMGYGLGQRMAAQQQLERACPECPFDFERLRTETVAAVRPLRTEAGSIKLFDVAQPMLAGRLHERSQAVAQDLEDYHNLHQVRIIGKRLRYAMEVFANCFAPAFRTELYPLVEEMQEILGRANDSFVACQRLGTLREQLRVNRLLDRRRFDPGLRKLLRLHEQRLPRERKRFKEWWDRWQQVGAAAFAALLQPPAVETGPPAVQRPPPGGSGAGSAGITGTELTGGASPKTGEATPP